jgi:signal transduction histidine kinase
MNPYKHTKENELSSGLTFWNHEGPGDQLLPTIAHELRQPLNAILMALEIVRNERGGESGAREAREIAKHQALHMSRIIDDMLDTFCQGRLHLNVAPVDLLTTVNDAIKSTRLAWATSGHRISVSLPRQPVSLVADPSRLVQILTNLLTNAAKYTDPGGHISLSADLSSESVVIRVRDNGQGMSPELLPRIFDLYQRGPHQRERGLGLGLTLVKSLVELHGGSVAAHSQGLGMGSEFIVCLPIANTCHPESSNAPCHAD